MHVVAGFLRLADFLSYMDNVIAKRTEFGKIDERLNIDVVPKSAVAAEYDEQIAHAERELKAALEELNKQRTTALERELKGEITAEQRVRGLQRYEDAVTIAQREVLRLKEAKGRGVRAAKESEISLFGLGSVETSIIHLVSIALSHKEGSQWQSLGEITSKQKQDIEQATGINVQDYSEHILDESNIRHAWKRHTNPTIEESRNQIPLTEADFALIPFVLQEYDSIKKGLSGKLQTIEYYKLINDYIVVVEEMRTKRKKLAFKTMYKKKASLVQPAMPKNSTSDRAAQTPEAYRACLENKNTTSSLEHQGLSEVSVTEINAQVLARWNNSSLTAEQREQTRRAAVLLNISEKDLYKNTKQLLEAKAVALNAQIRQQSDTMHRLWGKRKGAWGRTTEADNKRERKIQILRFQLAEIKNTIEKLQRGESISARKIATLLSDSDDSALSLQENTLENASMDFRNIRLHTDSNAPDKFIATGSVYFETEELASLYVLFSSLLSNEFAPVSLPFVVLLNASNSVLEEFETEGLHGKYFYGEPSSIHLRSATLHGFARAVFWHEYAHHIWQHYPIQLQEKWKRIVSILRQTSTYDYAAKLDFAFNTTYLTSEKEMWARLVGQYFLLHTHDDNAWKDLSAEPEGFWTKEDIASVENVLREIFAAFSFHIDL